MVRSKKKSRISLHSRSGSFPPPSSLLPPSVRSSLPFSKMPNGSASANVQSGAARCLADPLLPIRVGLTQKLSKKEWNHWRVVCSSHLGKDDWLWKRNTNRFPLFRVLIERSEIKVYDKVSEVSMVFYFCVVSAHSGRLRTWASLDSAEV